MTAFEFTDQERAAFLELAKEIGITRAKRQLGYPKSWATGQKWAAAAGIEVPLDAIKAQAAAHNDWYKAEDMLIVVKEGLLRAIDSLQNEDLTPDDQKKLAEACQKYVNTALLLEGKATSITQTQHKDSADLELMDLINEEKARNATIEQEVESNN